LRSHRKEINFEQKYEEVKVARTEGVSKEKKKKRKENKDR